MDMTSLLYESSTLAGSFAKANCKPKKWADWLEHYFKKIKKL
jgi:hypothetical protein